MFRTLRFKIVAVGVNCVNPNDVAHLLALMNTANHWSAWPNVLSFEKVPYVVYPNAGSIDDWDHVNKCWAKPGNQSDILDNVKVIFLSKRQGSKINVIKKIVPL